MAIQNNIDFLSTLEFLSKECKTKNHVNCCKAWTGIGIKVICNCNCHNNNNSDDNDTIQIRRHLNE
jgi:hypothetical protein